MLTKRQKQILDFIEKFVKEKDYAPSLEEIGRHFKLAKSTVHQHIETLREKGYLKKIDNQPRSIELNSEKKKSDLVEIPLLGVIAAGEPIEAIELPDETISIAKNEISKLGDYYALRVKGNSMINEGIFNGDIVILKKQQTADNGQTVVAIIDDNEATLKKIYKEKNCIKLQPANQKMLPIYRKEVEVRGIVIKIIRNLENKSLGNTFFDDFTEKINLNNPFFNSQLITCIGNKRRLLPFLYKGFSKIRSKIGKRKLIILDGFVGSGAVARLLKYFASELYVNDLEDYAETINSAYLANKSELNINKLEKYINWLNENKLKIKTAVPGFIEKNYAPKDDNKIKIGERVFYTNTNAKIIDNLRRLINEIPKKYRHFCLASLLVEASIHTNTSGVFKGFHKRNGNGHFGGDGENALSRIKQEITLEMPIFSDFECPVHVHKRDLNELVKDKNLPTFDLAYYDPPYNQHPYGSNYFMLNIINGGKEIEIQDGVSGISKEWNRSAYNKRGSAEKAMDQLLADTRAHFIAISYNNEGIIPIDNFKKILSRYGKWELMEQDYNTYRGSRNLHNRDIKVKELLWILEKK